MIMLEPGLIRAAAEAYVELFRKKPRVTGIFTLTLGIILTTAAIVADRQSKAAEEKRLRSLSTYNAQLQQLQTVQQSLHELSTFVDQQKERLEASEQLISRLQEEKRRIEPLVQADRKTVEAVFQLQEERASRSVSVERWIGFGLGVLASLFASFIFSMASTIWERRKMKTM